MRTVTAVTMLFYVAGLAACSEPTSQDKAYVAPVDADWASVAGFDRSDGCGAAPQFPILPIGARIETAYYQDGVEVSRKIHTVTDVSSETTWSTDVLTFVDDRRSFADPTESAITMGFIDAGFRRHGKDEGEHRTYTFPADLRSRVVALKVGETTTFPVSESTNIDSSRKSLSGEFRVSLLGCGAMSVLGRPPEPVHVYRVQGFNRAYRAGNPPTDIVATRDTLSYVGDRQGHRIFTGKNSSGVYTLSINARQPVS